MTYLSIWSGIEAVTVAWEPLGWQAVGFAEIAPFPCELLRQKYPAVKNYGDITQYEKWDTGQFDILAGGTPCQSFSIAGLRRGLDNRRGSLMLTFAAIASYYKPRWIVFENVPGVLSSNGGRDFGAFLTTLAQCGYGAAYRVLDAQYFGVPQRRRRVFVVGHLGDWRRAATVLFDGVGVQGHSKAGKKTGEETTHPFGRGIDYFRRTGNYKYHIDKKASILRRISSADCSDLILDKTVTNRLRLRRLTPLECERLQGFPDNWTQIEWNGKPKDQCPDSHRYKAIGNSMAVPVMRWIGERIGRFDGYSTVEKKRKYTDYERLYELLKAGPVSFERIREETGLDKRAAAQVITTLSLKYPVYSPKRGVYALL